MAIVLFGAKTIQPDHAFGAMARELLPHGFVGLMLACVMASVMDNCAIMMLTFAGIYTNSIHNRFIRRGQSEVRLVFVTRIAAACFAAICIGMSYAFDDVPAAMRFLWKTVSPMGIPFFLGICWARANRYGAFASVLGAFAGLLVAEYAFKWTGDAGLPKSVLLFLSVGALAGVAVSVMTRPEARWRVEWFFLLLRTPIGQEDALRRGGLTEVPGTGTFEFPREGDDGEPVGVHEDSSSAVPTEEEAATTSRRQAVLGLVVVTVIMFAMLGGVKLLAAWLAGN